MKTKTLEDILFQVYELGVQQTDCDITKKANTIMMLANQRVIDELYYIAEQGNFEFKAMGFVLASRVKELTGSNKLSKGD